MASESVVVVGAGCFGLTAALQLSARGWRVTLLDQGSVPHPDAASTDISKVVRADYGRDSQHTAMGEASIDGWRACLYCDTFDCAFWIDHNPGRPGLIVAAGDSGHGFKFAQVLGGLIADVVERKPNPWAARCRWRARADARADTARA